MTKTKIESFIVSVEQKKDSSGFVALPILLLIAIGAALVAKSAYDKSHVLGESSLIAQAPADGSGAGSGTGGSAPPSGDGGGGSAPQQQSQPAPQQESQPQQQPQQDQAPQPAGSTNPQPESGRAPQQQYQYQPSRSADEQRQRQQYQPSGQNQGTGQDRQQGQPGIGSQGQVGQQQGPQGQANQSQNVYVSQFSEKQYQEFQKHYEQEASKFGFQINGSLPSQFLDRQSSSGQGSKSQGGQQGPNGPQGQGGDNQNTSGQNQAGQNLASFLRSLPPVNEFPTIQGSFNVSSSTGGRNINLNDSNTRVQLWGQGSNSPLTAVKADGTQVQINKAELEKINAAMKLTTGSEVSQSGDNFSLRRGQVEAETHFPISFNVATKTFTVQTPNGEKELHVLPDVATQKLIENKVFSQLQTSTTTGEGGTTTTQTKVVLTQLDNKPVYEVEGASEQKFLGFVNVSIPKTVFVSAETGDSVKTQQTLTSQFLDLVSF